MVAVGALERVGLHSLDDAQSAPPTHQVGDQRAALRSPARPDGANSTRRWGRARSRAVPCNVRARTGAPKEHVGAQETRASRVLATPDVDSPAADKPPPGSSLPGRPAFTQSPV